MKKNIAIVILSIIIVILIYKAMVPTVVTERRINLQNRYSQTHLSQNLNKQKNKIKPNKENNDYYEETDEEYNEYTPPRFHYKGDSGYQAEQEEKQEIKPIRFPKGQNNNRTRDISEISPEPKIEQLPAEKETLYSSKEPKGFAGNFKACKPYKEETDSEYMGIKMHYEIEILGWINNKCTIKFTSKATGIGKSFEKEYGIDPSDAMISTFAPNIRCEFSKAQLLYVGDSILQENERNAGSNNNMLKNPNNIEFPEFENMTIQDLKLLQVVFADKACKMLNLEELKSIFRSITELYN